MISTKMKPLSKIQELGNETVDLVDWEALEAELASMDAPGETYAVHAAELGVS